MDRGSFLRRAFAAAAGAAVPLTPAAPPAEPPARPFVIRTARYFIRFGTRVKEDSSGLIVPAKDGEAALGTVEVSTLSGREATVYT